jgi:hypothetical protein
VVVSLADPDWGCCQCAGPAGHRLLERHGLNPGVCASSGANFMTERQVEDLVSEMLDRIGTCNRFIIVSCREVENCQATLYRGKPYTLYNPQFLGAVKSLNFSTAGFIIYLMG